MMIPQIQLQEQYLPDICLEGAWENQDTYGVPAQILLGTDHDVRSKSKDLLQTKQTWLLQSAITSNYIIFGQCETYS